MLFVGVVASETVSYEDVLLQTVKYTTKTNVWLKVIFDDGSISEFDYQGHHAVYFKLLIFLISIYVLGVFSSKD